MPLQIAGQPPVDMAHRPACFFKMISPGYFSTLGIRLKQGRALSDQDRKGAPPVTVVNDTFVKRYFKKENPIGQRILIQEIVPGHSQLGPEIPWQVVGVIADEKVGNLGDNGDSGMYVSNEQSPLYGMTLVARTAIESAGARSQPAAGDSRYRQRPASDRRAHARTSAVRIGGVEQARNAVAWDLRCRGDDSGGDWDLRRDLLCRHSAYARDGHPLGAGRESGDLVRMVLKSGLALAAVGLVAGFAGSLAVTRLMSNLLFGVSPHDPLTLALPRPCWLSWRCLPVGFRRAGRRGRSGDGVAI